MLPTRLYMLSTLSTLTLVLAGCGWPSSESPHLNQKTSALARPAETATPWGVLDNGIALIESQQKDAASDQMRRDHWAKARALAVNNSAGPAAVPQLMASLDDLDLLAVVSRVEIRSDIKSLQDAQALRNTTLHNFPAIRDVLAKDNTQDKMSSDQWLAFVNHFTEGLVRIHTLPMTIKDEESRAFLHSIQQQAMTAAILTQVHLAYDDYQSARTQMIAQATPTAVSKAWDKYATLMQSLGADALPEDADRLNPAQLSAIVMDRLQKTDPEAVHQWVQYAQNQFPVQNSEKIRELIPGDMTLVSYMPNVSMPLPQKISVKTGNNADQGRFAVDQASFLHVSHWLVKSLLDAPITEP